jgi:hypothetical protein
MIDINRAALFFLLIFVAALCIQALCLLIVGGRRFFCWGDRRSSAFSRLGQNRLAIGDTNCRIYV